MQSPQQHNTRHLGIGLSLDFVKIATDTSHISLLLQTACCTFYSYNVDSLHSGTKEGMNCKHKDEYGSIYLINCEHYKKAHHYWVHDKS